MFNICKQCLHMPPVAYLFIQFSMEIINILSVI